MKPTARLRNLLAIASSSLLAISSASATTYTWTQLAVGSQDWTAGGNWSSGQYVSGSGNELRFFPDTSATYRMALGTQTIINVPSTLLMNTLTLNGQGPNDTKGTYLIIGDNTSTWTIGDGTTSTVNLNSGLGGGSADRDIRYTIAANLELNGGTSGITTFTGGSPSITGAVFSGNITETASGKGITKSGSSLLIFSGSNNYTGTTLVSGGTLRLNSATALSGGLGATGGTSALTINGGVVELGAGNFQRNLGTGSDQFRITGGTSGFSARGGPRVITVNNDASQELVWGSASFQPGTLVLNAASANNSLELTNKIDLAATTRTVQVDADKALLSGVIRTASGTAGLTKTNGGTLVLTGSNTYNGTTTLTGGTLSIGAANNIGVGNTLNMNGGTLQITGTTLTSISGLGHTVSFANNAKGFDIHNAANTFTVDQVLTGTTFGKSGVGTLVLNQNNSLSGATFVGGGGTLVLDYSTNNGSKIGNAALNLSGGNLVLRGGSGGKSVTSIVLAGATGNSISRDGSSTATIANAGVLTIGFLANLAIAEAGIVSTTSANVNGIQTLGGVTVGSDFATNVSNLLQAYSTYTPYTAGGGGGSGAVVNQLTGGGTMTGSLTSYSLKIANSGSSDVLTLGANSLSVTNGGTVLYAGGSDNNYTINGSGAVRPVNGNQPMTVNVFTGTLTVNAILTSGGSSTLAKAGAGTLVAGGASAYGGPTYIQQGVLRLANNAGAGTIAGGIIVQGGAVLELSQTTAVTPANITVGAEGLWITGTGISDGGALRNHSGSNTYQGPIAIGASGARINANASSTLTLTGGIGTTLTQDVTIGGAGNTTVSTAAISGSGGLIKDGAGTLTLSATNTYTGATTVSEGTLSQNAPNAGNEISTVTIASSGATYDLNFAGTDTVARLFIGATQQPAGVYKAVGSAASGTELAQLAGTGTLTVTSTGGGGGPGPVDHFVISAISSPQTVGTPITDITLTAKDASNVTATSFTGTVTFGGTGGFSGTSASFVLGVLSGVSVTPTVAGSNLTFIVTDPVSTKFGTTPITTIQTQYVGWSGASDFDADANGDGVQNGLAFLLGAANKNDSALSLLPKVSQSGGDLILDFTCLKVAGRGTAVLKLQHSNDLGISDAWTVDEVAVPDTAGVAGITDVVTFTVPTVNANPNLVDLRATIPASAAAPGTKLFGRLQGSNP